MRARLRIWLLRVLDRDGLCLEYEREAQKAVAERNRMAERLREIGALA